MDGRFSYQQQFQVGDPLLYQPAAAFEPASRTFAATVGRFFYRLIVFCLILGALGGVLFGLYRNDILVTIARGAGMEAQYRSLEQRVGAPGWGTPRSIELPKDVQAAPVAAAPTQATEPHETATTGESSTTVPAVATAETKKAEAKKATADGLPILSFDSLPSAPRKAATEAKAEPTPASLSSLSSTTRRTPESRSARAVPVVLRETPTERTIPTRDSKPTPAPKPEPVAKAAPAPKPEPPAPKVDPTAPRASDNPLKAAIRASMANKGKSE
jgi:hypothetical protein